MEPAREATPDVPCAAGEGVVIAVRMPSGKRIKHEFHRTAQLRSVLKYVQATEGPQPPCVFVTSEVPARTLNMGTVSSLTTRIAADSCPCMLSDTAIRP